MKLIIKNIFEGFLYIFVVLFLVVSLGLVYLTGIVQGYNLGKSDAEIKFVDFVNNKLAQNHLENGFGPSVTPFPTIRKLPTITKKPNWGGPELWNLVNKRRIELGVNQLKEKDELCTIASIRLNELLELGKLDGHEGFGNLKEKRKDLSWIFDNYSVVAEFLATGGSTAQETVNMWENTLAHKKILDGGEFVWGCIYAQDTYAVAIVSY
jgi:hypothetical protein